MRPAACGAMGINGRSGVRLDRFLVAVALGCAKLIASNNNTIYKCSGGGLPYVAVRW